MTQSSPLESESGPSQVPGAKGLIVPVVWAVGTGFFFGLIPSIVWRYYGLWETVRHGRVEDSLVLNISLVLSPVVGGIVGRHVRRGHPVVFFLMGALLSLLVTILVVGIYSYGFSYLPGRIRSVWRYV